MRARVRIQRLARRRRRERLGGILIALATAMPVGARAATLAVDTVTDGVAGDGNCTLREAVIAANTDTSVDGCGAGSGADVIELDAGMYALTVAGAGEDASVTGDLDITSEVILRGAGAESTIVRAAAIGDRVVHVLSTGTVTIEQLTIRDGATRFGGGVLNAGSATLKDCTVTANTATGVAGENGSGGAAGGGGGGVFNASGATLQIVGCAITSNAAIGGAGQHAARGGGGGGGGAAGGGVFNDGGSVTGTRVTITENRATGGDGGNGMPCGPGSAGGGGGGFSGAGGAAGSFATPGSSALGGGGGSKGGLEGSACDTKGGNGGFASGGGGSAGTSAMSGAHGGPGGAGTACSEGRGGGGGGGGLGGGLFSQGAGSVTLVSTTITGNLAAHGNGGGGGGAAEGTAGQGVGGGLYVIGAAGVTIGASTVSGNSASTSDDDASGAIAVGVCGDGATEAGEACDDGNRGDHDGCSAVCAVELLWACSGAPSTCQRDIDQDGVVDIHDNCRLSANADQRDDDHDGVGDHCDRTGEGGCSTGGDGLGLIVLVALGMLITGRRRTV